MPATGEVLWSFASGGSCNAGAAGVQGMHRWQDFSARLETKPSSQVKPTSTVPLARSDSTPNPPRIDTMGSITDKVALAPPKVKSPP